MRRRFDWWFRDRRTGRIVIAQWPNLTLWLFIATVVVRPLLHEGSPMKRAVTSAGVGILAWWSLDEIIRGVNPWRRLLGLTMLGFTIAGLV